MPITSNRFHYGVPVPNRHDRRAVASGKLSAANRANVYAKTINHIDPDQPIEQWAPQVIMAFCGDADGWYIYDNEFWREDQFWMARQVRNHPAWGPKLFKSFVS
jgi:hypothetical protein